MASGAPSKLGLPPFTSSMRLRHASASSSAESCRARSSAAASSRPRSAGSELTDNADAGVARLALVPGGVARSHGDLRREELAVTQGTANLPERLLRDPHVQRDPLAPKGLPRGGVQAEDARRPGDAHGGARRHHSHLVGDHADLDVVRLEDALAPAPRDL